MPDWKRWADKALNYMDENDLNEKEDQEAACALHHIKDTGYEPYITLKAYVFRMYDDKPTPEDSPLRKQVRDIIHGVAK